VERVDGLAGLGPDLVGERERAGHPAVDDDVEHRGAVGRPVTGERA